MSRARIFDLQILTALLFASLLSGFPLEMSASSPASQPSAVETAAFIKGLQGLPAQYRADLLLMALSNSKPTERLPYTELLKNTIRDLVADVEQYPQYYAGTRSSSDTIEMETATASAYVGLDALTLRTRLLRMLSTTDRAWTIKEMERTRIPLERIECSASLVPDVSGYYQLISDLNFSSGENAPLSRVIWLRDHIGEVSSPVAIPDIANLLSQIAFKPEDLKILALQFNSTLSRLKATDREATYLFNGRSSSTYITALVKRLRRDGIDPSGTTHAYRQFLTNSLGETRCADSTTDWTNAVSQFNELSR